jgi:ABC-2 type transport system permease protein
VNKTLKLTRVLLRTAGASFEIKMGKKGGKLVGPLFWGIMALCMLPLMFLLYNGMSQLFDIFYSFNELSFGVGLVTNMGGLIMLIVAMFSTPALFYFSKDIETLLPMPLTSTQIIAAKFIVSLTFELVGSMFIILPMTLALFPYVPAAVLLPNVIVTFFTMPIMPIIYATLITMFFVRVTRFGKNRDFYNIIIGVISIIFGMTISFTMQSLTGVSEAQLIEFFQGNRGALDAVRTIFPSNLYNGMAIAGDGFQYQLLNLLIIAGCLAAFFLLAKLLYFKGVIGISEASSPRKKMTKDELMRGVASRGMFSACMQKETRQLMRNPVAFTNCVLMVYLMPVVMGGSMFFTLTQQEVEMSFLESINYGDPMVISWMLIISSAVGFFFSAMNTVTATAISREGPNFFVLKYIPVPYKTQLLAKVASGAAITIPAMLLFFIAAQLMLNAPPLVFLGMLLLSLPGGIVLSYIGLLVDLARPKLDWENEAYAVKQNVNVMLIMFGGMLMVVPVILLGMLLVLIRMPVITFAVLFLLTTGIAAGAHFILMGIAEKRMMKIG